MSGAPGYPSTVGRVLTRSAVLVASREVEDELPRNASGKPLTRELRGQLSAPAASSSA